MRSVVWDWTTQWQGCRDCCRKLVIDNYNHLFEGIFKKKNPISCHIWIAVDGPCVFVRCGWLAGWLCPAGMIFNQGVFAYEEWLIVTCAVTKAWLKLIGLQPLSCPPVDLQLDVSHWMHSALAHQLAHQLIFLVHTDGSCWHSNVMPMMLRRYCTLVTCSIVGHILGAILVNTVGSSVANW